MLTDANHYESGHFRFIKVADGDWRLLDEEGMPHLHSLQRWADPAQAAKQLVGRSPWEAAEVLRRRRDALRRGDLSALREDWAPPDHEPIDYCGVGYAAHTPAPGLGLIFYAGWSIHGSGYIKEHFIRGTT